MAYSFWSWASVPRRVALHSALGVKEEDSVHREGNALMATENVIVS